MNYSRNSVKRFICFITLIVLLNTGCAPLITSNGITPRFFLLSSTKKVKTALPWLLDRLNLSKEDLGIQPEIKELDALAIPMFGGFMGNPFLFQKHAAELNRLLCASRINLQTALQSACAELGIMTRKNRKDHRRAEPSRVPIIRLMHAADRTSDSLADLFSTIPPTRRIELLETLETLLFQEEQALIHEERAKNRRERQQDMERALVEMARFDRRGLLEAALDLCREIDAVLESGITPFPENTTDPSSVQSVGEGEILFFKHRPGLGNFIVGGKGDNTYFVRRNDIIVDIGGDDRFIQTNDPDPASRAFPAVSIILDMEGDDLYVSSGGPAQGSGVFGVDILVDLAGNDRYLGRNMAQGCGVMGVGILADREGDDRYIIDTFGQGAGGFGVGLLLDHRGNDVFQGGMLSQGVGFTGGAGFLVDQNGNDQYSAGQAYPDLREEGKFSKSLSQGFGFGIRDYAPGGFGLLLEGGGNDIYAADYFGQGAAYWLSVGLLADASGNDRYMARRYVQGAGIHLAAGALIDARGDDSYAAWGVAQGCGHDYASGLLYDQDGNDLYKATWLSQGAGNSQGVGILADAAGDDLYDAPGETVRGSGAYNNARGAGSVGIFVDGGGADSYRGPGRNGSWWRSGKYGGGGDFDGINSVIPESWFDVIPDRRPYSTESMMRQTGDFAETIPELERSLYDKNIRDAAVEKVSALGPDHIPAILSYLDIRDILTQITVTDIFKAMDERAAVNYIRQALQDSGKARKLLLIYLLGEIGGSEAADILALYLDSPEKNERMMAARGMWKLGAPIPAEEAVHLAEDESPRTRRYLAHILGRASDIQSLRILKALLKDKDYNVRFAAAEALSRRWGSAAPPGPDGEN